MTSQPPQALRLSTLLAQIDAGGETGHPPAPPTLGDILDRTAHAGFGFLLALLALVAIPFFGVSLPFGLAIACLGAQMVAGRSHPWLPGVLRRRVLPRGTREWLGAKLARFATRLERLVRPRLRFAVRRPLVGLGLIAQGIGLALPLPIPGSNWIFIVPVLIYAVGLLEDDGLWVLFAHFATVAQIVLAVLFARVVGAALTHVVSWFA